MYPASLVERYVKFNYAKFSVFHNMRTLPFDTSHEDEFFMYWSRQLKISSALNSKK
jgi:hypothetical protein